MATTLRVVQNNTAPPYQITCERDDGTLIDLTNCTVTLNLARGNTKTNTGHETCTVTNAVGGIITWQPKSGDIGSPGTYKGDVVVHYPDTTQETLYGQLVLKVRRAIS